ncbi:hypothetical protein ABK040_014421 [Willaertia magna]
MFPTRNRYGSNLIAPLNIPAKVPIITSSATSARRKTTTTSTHSGSNTARTPKETLIQEVTEKNGQKRVVASYKKGCLLGEGGFAKCYEVMDMETGSSYAAKVISKASLQKEKTKQKLLSEIKIHRKMNFKYVVKFEKFFEDSLNAYILLEMCHCKSLMELMEKKKRLTEPEAQYLFAQILLGVKYLHSSKIIHRDLKLGNIFLDKHMKVKLGDFGLATEIEYEGQRKKTICGTPNYIAPEILNDKGHSYEVDIWSCGVILYTLLIGTPPFETNDVKSTYKKIQEGKYSFPEDIKISDYSKRFIRKMLSNEPRNRPTINEALTDDFFKSFKSISCPSSFMKYASVYCNQDVKKNLEILQKEQEEKTRRKLEEERRALADGQAATQERAPLATLDPNVVNSRANSANGMLNRIIKKVLPTKKKASPLIGEQELAEVSAEIDNVVIPKESDVLKVLVCHEYPDYGLAYRLNNGATGAYFNDSTKIIIDKDQTRLEYYDYQRNDIQPYDERFVFTLTSFPEELKKKVTLIKYFRNCLDQLIAKNKKRYTYIDLPLTNQPMTYIKKYNIDKKASSFRLSNLTVQVQFHDSSEILMRNNKTVTYTNANSDTLTFPFDENDLNISFDLQKRLDYTKEVLQLLLVNSEGEM